MTAMTRCISPSPLRGEGRGEGGHKVDPLHLHPLPNPSPLEGEGLKAPASMEIER
jgi:hypothetical protein